MVFCFLLNSNILVEPGLTKYQHNIKREGCYCNLELFRHNRRLNTTAVCPREHEGCCCSLVLFQHGRRQSTSPLHSGIGNVRAVVVSWDYLGIAEGKIPLQPVLGDVRVVVGTIWDYLAMAEGKIRLHSVLLNMRVVVHLDY